MMKTVETVFMPHRREDTPLKRGVNDMHGVHETPGVHEMALAVAGAGLKR